MGPPFMEKTFIEMYSNDLCRSLKFNFKNEMMVKGINSYEFVADHSLFANGTENPLNSCFEPQTAFLPSGVFNTSVCRFGAPVFVSQPHFHQADPYYLNMVGKGIAPNSSLHSTYLRIEPRAGVPTDVTARFQLNVLIDKVSGISMMKGVSRTFFPVMWFENKAGVPDELVFKMKLLANLPSLWWIWIWTPWIPWILWIPPWWICLLWISYNHQSPILLQKMDKTTINVFFFSDNIFSA